MLENDKNGIKIDDNEFDDIKVEISSNEFDDIVVLAQKKSEVGNESAAPLPQGTERSAMPTTENGKADTVVTEEYGKPAIQLKEVEITPKPELGYLQSFMAGIADYDDLQKGYDILQEGNRQNIIDYYNQRYSNKLNNQENSNAVKDFLRMFGGTAPMMGKVATAGITGGAIGSAVPVVGSAIGAAGGSIAEGIYEGQKLSKSSAFEEAFFDAKNQGMPDNEAFEKARRVSNVAQIAGGLEGGASGFAGGTVTNVGKSVLKNIAKEIVSDAVIGGSAATTRRIAENVSAQQEGIERDLASGVGQEFTGEATFVVVVGGLIHSPKLLRNRKKAITAIASTDAPKAISIIDKSVESGDVSVEDGNALKQEIVETAKAFEATPESMPYEEREALTPVIAERQKLQKEFEKVSPATQPIVQAKIELIDKSIPIPLPTKYMDTAGQNTSELKDGQLYITRKGDVRMWDAAQKQFLEPPKSFEVEAKKQMQKELDELPLAPITDDAAQAERKRKEDKIRAKYETEQVKPTEETAPQPEVATEAVVETPTETTAEAEVTTIPQAGVVGGEVEAKRIETEAKIKRKDLFIGVGEFSKQLGGSDKAAVPVSHKEKNGIEFVEYAHPKTGSIDVIVTGKSDNDFVGFYRIYENGKPTNKWSSKFENQSRNKEDFKTMISGVQEMLPQSHEYTEKTSISTDGLRIWNQQLSRGYELQYDEKGKLITNLVAINGDAIVNELGIPVEKGEFKNIRIKSKEEFENVKKAILPYLEKFGLGENDVMWLTGTVKINLPVLKSTTTTPQAGSVGGTNPALADVESTAKALEGVELNTLNPTGSIFSDYTSEQRDKMPLGKNLTTYDKTAELTPDQKITVYRGSPKNVNEIKSGDFITTNKQLAKDYAGGDGKVISKEVRADEILDDITEPLGEEYILREKKNVSAFEQRVEATAKALEGIPVEIYNKKLGSLGEQNRVAELYHKSKSDGSNPELVKAVEELLAPESQAKPLQTEAESQVETLPTAEIDQVDAEVQAPTAELVDAPSITETEAKTLKQEKINEVQDAEIKRALEDEEARIRRAAEKIQKADELQGEFIDNVSDYKESVIADNMGRVTEQSFKDFSDKNNITPAIREAYFSKPNAKIPTTIDQLAKEMSDLVGLEITTKDIVDFMNKYPDGVGSRRGNKDKKTFYAENNPRDRRAELLAEAEVILGYALDEEGMERFNNEVEKLQNDLADINARPISDKDIDALSQEYDEYFNTLTDEQKRQELAKQRIEGEQIVEGAEDANRKAIQERDARQQEAKRAEERAKQEPVVEGVETIDDRIAKKLAELKERKKGKFYSGLDFENLDLYTELAYLYIRKGVKSAADFAKEIGENLSEAIKKAWDNANANVKAETENFNKWKDYAKRQFEAEDGSLEFQEFKARFNKRFNVAADDVALVEIFSEAQSEYNAERGKSVSRKEVDKSFKPERKKVEVDEKAALKDQIRLEAKAAKEGFREARKQQQSFADRIKAFLDSADVKGKLSPAQVKSLINRASNIKTELQLDRFIDYAEKVIDNVNYDAEMNELRRQQKQAKSRKHTSMTKAVDEFLSINPERIPDNLLPEYQKALDELSGRVPSYTTFQNIYHQVMALAQPKDTFSNVKTYQDAVELYNKIGLNKVKSIEDYRDLFKDINAFKRKVAALFENGDITEQEYNDLVEQVGKDQDAVEAKYASEIYSLKTDLILEMKNMLNSISLQNITEEGKALLRDLNKLDNNDLRNLSPEELYNLASILDNVKEIGFVDAFRLNDIIGKANAVTESNFVAEQIGKSKPFEKLGKSVKQTTDKLGETYSAFWEDKFGLGSRAAGAYYTYVVSPMEKAVSSYRNAVQDGYKKISELKKKYSIGDKEMDRIGLFAIYLREYGLGQDVDTKGKKDKQGELFGTRDWFKTILEQESKIQHLSKDEIKAIKKAWDSLPKTNGKVDVEALEKSYRNGTNEYLTANEISFLKEMMQWKDENLTGKQQAANEFRGKPFDRLLYHIKRIRKDGGAKDVTAAAEVTQGGNVRIAEGSGKEVLTDEIGAIEHNFEKIFANNLEGTMRDYYLTPMLQKASQLFKQSEKKLGGKNGYVEVMKQNLQDAINNELVADKSDRISQKFTNNLLKARAAQVLIAPIRTVGELFSSLVSYPLRTKNLNSYVELFKKKDVAQKLLNETNSVFKDKANLNKHLDLKDGSLQENSKVDAATAYFAAMPERAGLLPVWMASFDAAFKNETGKPFDRDAYMSDAEYALKNDKAITKAAANADQKYSEITGSPTMAGQRRTVRFAPSIEMFGKSWGEKNRVTAKSPIGKLAGFMTGYPFREVESMSKATSAMTEAVKDKDAGKVDVIREIMPIVGSVLGAAAYGLYQSINYELQKIVFGDEDEAEQAKKNIETLTSPVGLLKETLASATSLGAATYSGAGRQLIKFMGTVAYNTVESEEDKTAIRSMIRNITFQDPFEVKFTKNGKLVKYMQKERLALQIADAVPTFSVIIDNVNKEIEAVGGMQYLMDKLEKGKLLTEPEKTALVTAYLLANTYNMVGMWSGSAIPITTLNRLAKKVISESEGKRKGGDNKKPKPLPTQKNKPTW